ncbi:MAG TPA: hypothetical protein PLM80_12225, partial [Mesotoga sp.]|nr:hypothetical protein [Mesotoga sp.]
ETLFNILYFELFHMFFETEVYGIKEHVEKFKIKDIEESFSVKLIDEKDTGDFLHDFDNVIFM